MNVGALAANYGRMINSDDLTVEATRRKFIKWLLKYECPLSSLPTDPHPSTYAELDSSAVSSDGDGGISAWWFLKGNDVIGVPNLPDSDSPDARGWRVPFMKLDEMPNVRLGEYPQSPDPTCVGNRVRCYYFPGHPNQENCFIEGIVEAIGPAAVPPHPERLPNQSNFGAPPEKSPHPEAYRIRTTRKVWGQKEVAIPDDEQVVYWRVNGPITHLPDGSDFQANFGTVRLE